MPADPETQKAPLCRAFESGARRIRTADLLGAIQVGQYLAEARKAAYYQRFFYLRGK